MTARGEAAQGAANVTAAINAGIDSYLRSSGVAMHPGVRREIVAHIQAAVLTALKKWSPPPTAAANAWWRNN